MYPDVPHLIRRINLHQPFNAEKCDKCHFQRSYAFRRKTRPCFVIQKSTLKRAQAARKNFDKCIDRCGIVEDFSEDKRDKNYKKMKKKKIRDVFIASLSQQHKALPWLNKWKSKKIHPLRSCQKMFCLMLKGNELSVLDQNIFQKTIWRYMKNYDLMEKIQSLSMNGEVIKGAGDAGPKSSFNLDSQENSLTKNFTIQSCSLVIKGTNELMFRNLK